MSVSIEVLPLKDNRDISFSDLNIFHTGCTSNAMTKHRNPIGGTYRLQCTCGLEIELPSDGKAMYDVIP